MMDLHFIRPGWLILLPLAILIPVLWRRLRRPSGDWGKVCDAHLLRWLSVGKGGDKPGVMEIAGATADMIDLNGSVMMPGFIEPHLHFTLLSIFNGWANIGADKFPTVELALEELKRIAPHPEAD